MATHNTSSKLPRRLAKNGYVVGVDIGGTKLRIGLADAKGELLARLQTSSREIVSPEALIRQVRSGVNDLLRQASVAQSSLRAIAVGVPGVTEPKAGMVLLTSFFGGWKNVPLRSALESALDLPAAIENDVKLAAIGERWLGAARGLSDFVFFAIGTGIAAGIFVNGQLLRGVDSAAGEVGYMLVPGTSEQIAGPGVPGALECAIGGEGLRLEWQRICKDNHERLADGDHTATEVFELGGAGNPLAKKFLERAAQMLAYAVYNMAVVLNPSLFVLGGGVGMNPVFLEATQRILERYSEPLRPKLAPSALGEDAQLLGSVRLALDTGELRTAGTA
jgi:predicted NBD/HSP70 family sugar kinase